MRYSHHYIYLLAIVLAFLLLPLFSGAISVPFSQSILSGLPNLPPTYVAEDHLPPDIYDIGAKDIGPTSLKLRWTTNESASCNISWWAIKDSGHPGADDAVAYDNLFNTYHLVAINFLNSKTAYRFLILCRDGGGNESDPETFDTTTSDIPDTMPPDEAMNLGIINEDKKAVFTWDNPKDIDFAGVVIVRKSDKYPVSNQDGAIVFKGNNNFFIDAPLENNQVYYYLLSTFDKSGNYSRGLLFTASPYSEEEEAAIIPPIATIPPSTIILAFTIADFEFWQNGVGMRYQSPDIEFENDKDLTIVLGSRNIPKATDKIEISFVGVQEKIFSFEKIGDGRYLVIIPQGRIGGSSFFAVRFFDANNKLIAETKGSAKIIEKISIAPDLAMNWKIFLALIWSVWWGKIFLSLLFLTTIPLLILAYWASWLVCVVFLF